MRLTEEQRAVVEAAASGQNLCVAAFAGSGKTTTLLAIAKSLCRDILIVMFNKTLCDETMRQVRDGGLSKVEVRTAHSLAFRAVGAQFGKPQSNLYHARSFLARRLPDVLARMNELGYSGDLGLLPVLSTVESFAMADEFDIGPEHVPDEVALQGDSADESGIRNLVVEQARRVWETMSDPDSGCPITHDVYLKVFQLGRPSLPYDVVLFDEAQDANPAMIDIVLRQAAQKVFVGDRHQQIYGWRGAVNVLDGLQFVELPLTQSFRFGEAIADLANEILAAFKGEHRKIRGNSQKTSRVRRRMDRGFGDAVVVRTNAGAFEEVLTALGKGVSVGVAGDSAATIASSLEAAYRLYRGRRVVYGDFSLFRSWADLERLVQEYPDRFSQYRHVIRLVKAYGDRVLDAVKMLRERISTEERAELVVSTVHKAKGRQWESLRIGDDFADFPPAVALPGGVRVNAEEANVAYVAVTRACGDLYLGAYGLVLKRSVRLARRAGGVRAGNSSGISSFLNRWLDRLRR